ncbi:hypothetical protein O1611_g7044 [Lasiodiplodia mahajangana]|uniref:Uncharacterized protein n=1 Tax=Lasiodiplodia mahajangana TaxID=1108764 RepID=A0ACC2JGW9_9PEZI|nr:hypothetical protein O1611_g7044 [Lasiodiplodia mahajangana]
MITVKPLSLLLLVALPVFGSGIPFGNFDAFRDLDPKTHAATPNIDIYDKADKVRERPIIEKHTFLTKHALPSTASVLALVKPKALLNRQIPEFKPGDACDLPVLLPPCSDVISSRVSTQVSSSVSAAISSSVSISDASVLTSITNSFSSSLLAARQAGHDEGFQEGQRKASEIAQSMINSSRASSSPTVEDTTCAAETSSCVVGNLNGISHGLNLNAGQLAGILVAVFFISSISSILATILILRYRRKRAAIAAKTLPLRVEAPIRTPRPVFEKLRGNIFPSAIGRASWGSRRNLPKDSPRLPSQNHKAKASADRPSFTLPINTHLTRDQVCPVSPLSYHPPDNSMQESSPSLELGLYGNRTQMASRSESSGTPPIKLSLSRDETHNGPRRIQVVRMGAEGNTPHRLLSSNMQDSSNGMGEGTTSSAPMTTMSAFLPPIVPLRFSSLNAYKGLPIQRPSGSRGNDGTFLLSTDDESADRNPRFLQDQTGLQSPSHSSEISQDLTQFDPGGPGQQPTSRFSTSSARPSLGYSASSASPIPQYHQQQEEHPEISPLRPAPSSPLQLQAPTPRRPNIAANVGVDGPIYTL